MWGRVGPSPPRPHPSLPRPSTSASHGTHQSLGKVTRQGRGRGDSVVTGGQCVVMAGDPAKSGPSLAPPRAPARAAERVPAVKPRPPAVFLSPGHQQSPASRAERQRGPPPPAGARAPAGALRAGPLGLLSGDVGRPRGPGTRLWTVVLGGEGSHAPWPSRPPARHTHTLFPWLHPRLLPARPRPQWLPQRDEASPQPVPQGTVTSLSPSSATAPTPPLCGDN